MTILEEKKLLLNNAMKRSGYTKSEIARKIGKKPTTLHAELVRAKTIETFEKLEKAIREVI